MAVPLATVLFYPEDLRYAWCFLVPSLASILLGMLVSLLTPNQDENAVGLQLPMQKGSLPVLFAWCYAIFVGAIPFVLTGQSGMMYALFESVAGWTTTGQSVMDVTTMPNILLFHRAFMQYCGGLGFIVMIAMVVQGKNNMNLYYAEGHQERLMPSLRKTSQTIFLLYNCFLAAGALLYSLFGMDIFDAVCHAMSALATAGFTTQANSIGQYHSLPIEIVTIVLMLIGSTNFAILLLLVKGKFRQILQVSEVRFMLGVIAVFVSLTTFSFIFTTDMSFWQSLRHATFGIVAALSTTGYSIMKYTAWPPFAMGLLFVLMFIGGCAGSTAGGIKMMRAYLLVRLTVENVTRRLSSTRKVTALTYNRVQGKEMIDSALIKDTVGFITSYMLLYVAGTLLLTLTARCSLPDAMFEFAAAFGTTGISNGLTLANPNAGTLIVLMSGMILGRLEIFIVFIGVHSAFIITKRRIRRLTAGSLK